MVESPTLEHGEGVLMRHVDKGEFEYNEEALRAALPAEEAVLVMNVLEEQGYKSKKAPLRLEGLKRAMNTGTDIYNMLPERSILITIDSKKPRADLSEELITARIAQLETTSEKADDGKNRKRVDMLHIEEEELSTLMQDEGTGTWESTFSKLMETEGISERAAIAREINEIDQPGVVVPGHESLAEAADRYRKVLEQIRARITSKDSSKIPIVILGVGHSGPLSVIEHQQKGSDITEEEVPYFAKMYMFDKDNNFERSHQVEL